ncbi:GNAT family N-acetyltransferase [Micromonospora phytophila]|uniref:peptidogalycan biosysnthesis protein n=1 Tax=Micromonospora phytophila TaxID=709888 RepID=UPI0020303327|nr:peptidogalycan biosysnthesis protein [Micromonospora phytophila]MCM0673467.1 GNAT family N-acetyltransferase [Micromonospora phytophila]
MFDVRQVGSVREVSVEAWDRLGGRLYDSHAWHRFQEVERPGISSSHLLAYDLSGTLAAALPVYRVSRETHGNYQLHRQLPAAGAADAEQVLLGNRHGYNNNLLVRADLTRDQRVSAFRELVAAAQEMLRGVTAVAWWPYLDDESMVLLRPLVGGPTPLALKSECLISLPGTDFGDYLAALPKRRRSAVRADRRRFAQAGYQVFSRRYRDCVTDVVRLGLQTAKKYGGGLDLAAATVMMERQADALDDVSAVLACGRDGCVAGFALVMDHGRSSCVRTAGFDYAEAGNAAEYFELVYYRPIERAYALGRTELWLGPSSYQAKLLRGAVPQARWGLPLQVTDWPDAEVRGHNSTKLHELQAELGSPELHHRIPYDSYRDHC